MAETFIAEYEAALAEEKRLREEVFLGGNTMISGVEIRQITPRLLAVLNAIKTPFIWGGESSDAKTLQFLWMLSTEFVSSDHPERTTRIESLAAVVLKYHGAPGYLKAEREINDFIRITFMDADGGKSEAIPYVTGIAWMVYTMAKAPFGWDKERTLDTPLRELYQYTRCAKLEKGANMNNALSDNTIIKWRDKAQEEWLASNKGDN